VYTANTLTGDVSVIRTSDNTVVATVQVGGAPHRACALLDGSAVYVTRRRENKVFVIRTSDNTLVDSFVTGTYAAGIAMFPASEYAYVVNSGENTMSVIRPLLTHSSRRYRRAARRWELPLRLPAISSTRRIEAVRA